MELFHYGEKDFQESTKPWNAGENRELSAFDKCLCAGWDRAVEAGHFRYKLNIDQTKVIGKLGYVAQLNEKRAQERRKPDNICSVNQPFNPATFNFGKIPASEVLFQLGDGCVNDLNDKNQCGDGTNKEVMKVRNLVVINVSPLEYGHVLLVPDVDACNPQILTQSSVQLALEMLLLSKHSGFRVGFNSLCAYASVNHLHLHAYYLNHELFIEHTPVNNLKGPLYELTSMPGHGYALQLHGTDHVTLSRWVFQITDYFQKKEVAHNMFMTRGSVFGDPQGSTNRTVRVFIWPRKKFIGLKDEAAFNVALVELAGHLPIKVESLFNELTEESIESTIRDHLLQSTEYETIKHDLVSMFSQQGS
ncbi:GDP-D-glucose phosphorylase 1-like isoform X2 [Mya arenaria]|uniref:GDP-D-glucose phosphorylase 1-like isoform X2 n=1 Tax=Mya arenaria TaxID=6604 RepID=UPI0022E0F1D1|nr:GDP-D-glucose phosphorylase 1-like isoform X2 [Mya arenaria]